MTKHLSAVASRIRQWHRDRQRRKAQTRLDRERGPNHTPIIWGKYTISHFYDGTRIRAFGFLYQTPEQAYRFKENPLCDFIYPSRLEGFSALRAAVRAFGLKSVREAIANMK